MFADATARLQRLSAEPIVSSSVIQTAPVDCPPGSPIFLNAVIALRPLPGETPETLLGKLQDLEREFGRKPKTVMNEPRPLDLDLIAFGSETRTTPELTLPHPRAHLRRFVLAPLNELAPDLILPDNVGPWPNCSQICRQSRDPLSPGQHWRPGAAAYRLGAKEQFSRCKRASGALVSKGFPRRFKDNRRSNSKAQSVVVYESAGQKRLF